MPRRFQDPSSTDPFPLLNGETDYGRVVFNTKYEINDAVAQISAGESAGQGRYLGLAVSSRKLTLFYAVMAASLAVILLRAGHLQIVSGLAYKARAENNRSRIEWLPAERGVIFDRNGVPLVSNVPDLAVGVMPVALPEDQTARQAAISRIAAILGAAETEIASKLAAAAGNPAKIVVISERINHDQAVLLTVESGKTEGIFLLTGRRRDYSGSRQSPSLSHVLGFEGRINDEELKSGDDNYTQNDFIGKTGLEFSYETLLRGRSGKRRVEVDALGRKKQVIAEETAVVGKNLVLSIDLDLQRFAESTLRETLRAAGKARGSVVALNPSTGEILALVSEPAFDNNLFAQGISANDLKRLNEDENKPLFPRAIAASLPSGSTFKLVVGAAGLAEGIITPTTTVLSTGGIGIGKWFFPDWKPGGHGATNITKAIAESVNTFFYVVGGGNADKNGLGAERIVSYAEKFGFGRRLGIDLPGETSGFLPTKEWKEKTKGERWYVGDTYHLAIGQGAILVTPLQIAAMTAVFANGGKLIKPRVVNTITSIDGSRIARDPEIINPNVVDAGTIEVIRRGMRQAVISGSSRLLADLPWSAAAKTGTAQWHPTKQPHAWLTSFAPYDDPKIVITVVIEEGGEGSSIAAPVAKKIFSWYSNRQR